MKLPNRDGPPRLLDLFCGAGGATKGYQNAGFHVTGVDIVAQPHYCGDDFIRADAMTLLLDTIEFAARRRFDAFHASPPCQRYSIATPPSRRADHPDHIAAIRDRLATWGRPYAIENVSGARMLLRNPVMLCGTMFGLPIERHRYFEVWPEHLAMLPPCAHEKLPVVVTGTTRRKTGRLEYPVQACRDAMGIPWMTRTELDEAIPPAYTEWIGKELLRVLRVAA